MSKTWDPNKVRPVRTLEDMKKLVFDSLADPIAKMSDGNWDSPHKSTELCSFNGIIYTMIDDKWFKVEVAEAEDPLPGWK